MSIFDKIYERVGDIVDEVFLPETIRQIHDKSRALISEDKFERALALLQPTLIQHPEIARTHHLIGLAEFYLENYTDAIRALDRANVLRESPETLFYSALAFESTKDLRKAQAYLNRAASFGDVSFIFDLEFALGRVNQALGHKNKAVRHILRAQKIMPNQNDLNASLANAYCGMEAFGHAENVLKHARIPSDHVLGLIVGAKIFESKREFHSARDAWEKAKELAEDFREEEALLGLARNLNALEEYDTSLLLLNNVDLPEALKYEQSVLLGQAFTYLGNQNQGAIAFGKALKMEPFGTEALLGRGMIALANQEESAATYFERVLESNQEKGKHRAYYGLGLAKQQNNDVLSARHMFEEALEHDGDLNLKIWEILGDISLEYADAAEALWWFKKAEDFAAGIGTHDISEKKEDAIAVLKFQWDLPDKIDALDDVRNILEQLGEYLSSDGRLGGFMTSYQSISQTINSPLSVAVLGEFNAGKSSVVNALIGEKVVPVGVVPTTAQSGVIKFGPRKTARIVKRDGSVDEENFEDAKKSMKSNSDDIDHVEFLYPHPQLRFVNFWDTPGFNALEERHERVAKKALNSAEAILWVMDANQVLSQTQRDQIDTVKNSADRLIIIINKIDRVDDAAVEHLKSYVNEHIGDKILAVYGVSAKLAEKEETYDASCFAAFSEFFDEKVVQRAGRIKAIDARAKIENFAITLNAFQVGMLNRVDTANAHLESYGEVLEKRAKYFPKKTIKEEVITLKEWAQITLQGIESEVAESLKPVGTWSGKRALKQDDFDFILGLIGIRLDQILDRSFQRLSRKIAELESEFSVALEPIIRELPLQNARAAQRSVQSFFDESRRLRTHLDERVLGALRAETRGKIDAAGLTALKAVEFSHSDRSKWRSPLASLLPDFEQNFGNDLSAWLEEFFDGARLLRSRISAELEILQLESEYRFDVREISDLMNRIE